jgi:hypothetical protein
VAVIKKGKSTIVNSENVMVSWNIFYDSLLQREYFDNIRREAATTEKCLISILDLIFRCGKNREVLTVATVL